MRVDLVTKEFPPNIYGGAGVHVTELSRALREHVDLRIRCFGEPRDAQAVTAYAPAEHLAAAGPAEAAMGVSLDMLADLEGADIVHTHTWYANHAGALAQRRHGSLHVATSHSLEPLRPWKVEQLGGGYRLSSWIERDALESADAIIAVSRAMRHDIMAAYPSIDPHNIAVIHNGIDSRTFSPREDPDLIRGYGLDPDKPLAVFVGRITRQKGLPYLVRALAKLPTDMQMLLCAGSPDTPELFAEVTEFIGTAQQTHPGLVWEQRHLPSEELRAVLTAADVFVCPSVYEPLGIVNLEAMACGAAVVATDTGGIPEVVVDGETGWLVPIHQRGDGTGTPHDEPKFVADLAAAITAAYENPAECARRGAAGQDRAREHFSWRAIAKQTHQVYRDVAAGKRVAAT